MNGCGSLLERLHGFQDRALAIVEHTEAILRSGSAANAIELGHARWELTRVLTAYQMFMHRELFQPVIDGGRADRARIAIGLKADCIAIGEDFRHYVAKWSAVGITDRWAEYKAAALAIITRLRRHIARERWAAEQLLLAPSSGLSAA
jgi:hypothetical protein